MICVLVLGHRLCTVEHCIFPMLHGRKSWNQIINRQHRRDSIHHACLGMS